MGAPLPTQPVRVEGGWSLTGSLVSFFSESVFSLFASTA